MSEAATANKRYFHMLISPDELKRVRMVAADMGIPAATWLRPLILEIVNREYESRGLGRRRGGK